MSDDALTDKSHEELTQVVAAVSELTGLPSNWNGQLTLVPEAGFNGKKLYSCGILISQKLAATDLRWRTMIHEALHAVSVGYNRSDYEGAPGWEEGVVEQMQRLLRPRVLAGLSVAMSENEAAAHEETHRFNEWIASLERLRHALKWQEAFDFYLELLSTPIRDRAGLMLALSSRMSAIEKVDFIRRFSVENSLLKTPERKGL